MTSSSGFYRSVPRNNPPINNCHWEKKLDKIFDKVTEQGNQMLMLKEKGKKTLDSITNLKDKLSTLEDKMKLIEKVTTQSLEKKENRFPIPPELSVI